MSGSPQSVRRRVRDLFMELWPATYHTLPFPGRGAVAQAIERMEHLSPPSELSPVRNAIGRDAVRLGIAARTAEEQVARELRILGKHTMRTGVLADALRRLTRPLRFGGANDTTIVSSEVVTPDQVLGPLVAVYRADDPCPLLIAVPDSPLDIALVVTNNLLLFDWHEQAGSSEPGQRRSDFILERFWWGYSAEALATQTRSGRLIRWSERAWRRDRTRA
jgi:hypothetical protein